MDIEITDPDKIWELRLHLGDLGDIDQGDDQFLTDEHYQYFINRYTSKDGVYNFRGALGSSAMAILPILAKTGARQRIGQEEIYGKELVDNWLAFLKLLKKPSYSGITPVVYIGGVTRESTAYYANNPDLIDPPFYRGQKDRSPYWKYRREQFLNSVIEPEEIKAFKTRY